MNLKITYEGADVLLTDTVPMYGLATTAFICCNEKAERALYDVAKTDPNIGTLRTVFGLTFYAQNISDQYKKLHDRIAKRKLVTWHGNI